MVREGRWDIGDVDRSDVGSRRDDLVDVVEQVVVEEGAGSGEQVVELLGACAAR